MEAIVNDMEVVVWFPIRYLAKIQDSKDKTVPILSHTIWFSRLRNVQQLIWAHI